MVFPIAIRFIFLPQSYAIISNRPSFLAKKNFLRNSHEVSLTEAGETLLPLAKETLMSADNCLLRLDELKHLVGGELNIGVTFSFASIMAETVTAFLRKYPHVKMNVTPDKEMVGCIHLLKNTYVKNSTREFIRMLSDSTSILRNTLKEL